VLTPTFDLYLVSDRKLTGGRDLLWVLEQALEGGAPAVQLREKDLSGRELFYLAEKTRKLCLDHKAGLFVNDRIDVALAVDADGVQLGNDSIDVAKARELLGQNKLIGASTHSFEEATAAEQSGADFILFGPVYFTPSKAIYGAPQGLPALEKIVQNVSVPVYAIGGIKLDNLAEVKTVDVDGIALISAVIAASDPKEATRRILARLRR